MRLTTMSGAEKAMKTHLRRFTALLFGIVMAGMPVDGVPLGTNPNHVGYDPASKYLYVGFRDPMFGHLAIVDTQTGRSIGDIKTDALPGGIKIESAGPRIFVTLFGENKLGVVDRKKR